MTIPRREAPGEILTTCSVVHNKEVNYDKEKQLLKRQNEAFFNSRCVKIHIYHRLRSGRRVYRLTDHEDVGLSTAKF